MCNFSRCPGAEFSQGGTPPTFVCLKDWVGIRFPSGSGMSCARLRPFENSRGQNLARGARPLPLFLEERSDFACIVLVLPRQTDCPRSAGARGTNFRDFLFKSRRGQGPVLHFFIHLGGGALLISWVLQHLAIKCALRSRLSARCVASCEKHVFFAGFVRKKNRDGPV